jgi:hypothetical protein
LNVYLFLIVIFMNKKMYSYIRISKYFCLDAKKL